MTACLFRDGWSPCCRVWQTPSQLLPPSTSLFPMSRAWDSEEGHVELLSDSSGGRGFSAHSKEAPCKCWLGVGGEREGEE